MTNIERPVTRLATPRSPLIPGVLDVLSLLAAALMVAASATGLFVHGVYRDNTWSAAAFRGTDATTLFLVVPVLMAAVVWSRQGSLIARLVWLGVLAYNVYNYAFYAFGTAFNDLFLLYTATMATSLVVLVFAMPRVLATVTAHAGAPFRVVGGYLVLVGALFGVVWVVQSLKYVVNDELPKVITDSGIHTSIVFALDLTLVVPGLLITGVLLWRRTDAAVALGVVMNVLAVLYMAALAVAGAFQHRAGIEGSNWTNPPYLEVGIGSLIALILLVPHVKTRLPVDGS